MHLFQFFNQSLYITRGWLIVFVAFLTSGLVVGTSSYAFGLFITPLEAQFQWNRTAISSSLSLLAIGSLISPLIGRVMDRYGARLIMSISIAIFGLSFLIRPIMTELWQFYALSMLQAIGLGAAFLPTGRLIAVWFQNTTGRVMGIMTMGNNFGGAVMPVISWYFISRFDWAMAYLVIGLLGLLLAFLTYTVVREFPDKLHSGKDSKDIGGVLTGISPGQAIRSTNFYLVTITLMLGSFTYSSVLPWVSTHMSVEGIPDSLVPRVLVSLAILGMTGKVIFGYMAEIITARYALVLSFTGQILFILLMAIYPVIPIVWVTVPLYGFCMGGYGVLVTLIIQQHFGIKFFGSIAGLIAFASVIPSFGGPLIASFSFDLTNSYKPAFFLTVILFSIAILSLLPVGKPKFFNHLS